MTDRSEFNLTTPSLAGQVAIVTGGGRGLGRAFAQLLAAAGAAVAVTARTEEQLDETVRLIRTSGGQAIAFTVDVTDQAAMAHVVAEVERELGPVDILINNAAVITPFGDEWEVDVDEWWRTLEINVRGPYLCTRLVLPGMMARRQGRIVNVSSGAAYHTQSYYRYSAAYATSKAALTRMTWVHAEALREYGISIFALNPGGLTAMIVAAATDPKVPEAVRSRFRRALEEGPDDTERSAQMVLFLVSGQADFLSGRQISDDDSIDELLQRADEIVREDLYTLHRSQ